MKPIGLTMKMGRNKYQRDSRGELMLIHQCTDCGTLSINRIAADDDSGAVMTVFQQSLGLRHQMHALCQENGIVMLKTEDTNAVYTQLYGRPGEIPILSWA
jgi:hypothetical protein